MELLAGLVAFAAFLQVLYQFIVGKHFIIPTAILLVCVLFGNLARYGLRDALWAKHILFWYGFILSCYLFFALFWAAAFRRILGDAFLPVFVPLFVVVAVLTVFYKKTNNLKL
jgi:hypothetical protein